MSLLTGSISRLAKAAAGERPRMPKFRYLLVGAAATGVAGVSVIGLPLHQLWPGVVEQSVRSLADALRESGAAGQLVVSMLNVLTVASGVLPASLFGLLAGAIYGTASGFVLASISTMIGATLSFQLSRSMFRPFVARILKTRSHIEYLDAIIAGDGWKVVCLLRLSPILPFAATSYCLGLSSIGWRDYLIGTLAALPSLLGYVLVGATTGSAFMDVEGGSGMLRMFLLAAGSIAVLLTVAYLGRLMRRARVGSPSKSTAVNS